MSNYGTVNLPNFVRTNEKFSDLEIFKFHKIHKYIFI